jgi:small-conductance mechanosensitive channel
MALSDRLESLREQLTEKKEQRRQAKQKRRERIERNAPEGAREEIQATGKQAQLLAAELGVSRSRAEQIVDRGTEAVTQAAKAGDEALAKLDSDGDGDTDILKSLEEGMRDEDGFGAPPPAEGPSQQSSESSRGNNKSKANEMQDPLRGGIESEIGLDYDDLEQQVDISRIEDDIR